MRPSPALDTALLDASATGGLCTRRALATAGVTTAALARALRTGRVVRVARGVYAAEALPRRPRWLVTEDGLAAEYVLIVRAFLLSWGASVAATGRTAALLRGWELLEEPKKHALATRHGAGARLGRTHRKDVLVKQTRSFRAVEVVPVTGGAPVLVVPADVCVMEALLTLPDREAVVLADSAMRAKDVTMGQLLERAAALPGHRQVARARQLLAWCDPESGSVLESVLRYLMHQSGVTGFRTQRVLSRNGRRVLRTDFSFAAERLVVEADGSRWHEPQKDRRVDNQLVAVGWRVMRVSWADVVEHPQATLQLIVEALAAVVPMAA